MKLETDEMDAATASADAAADDLAGLCGFYTGLTSGYPNDWVCDGTSKTPSDYCGWAGINCADSTNGPVTALSFNEYGLHGTISSLIGKLVSLTYLSVGSNGMSGAIPAELGGLTDLLELDLYGNSFTKSLPTTLGNLKKMSALTVYRNSLTGSLPSGIWQMTDLVELFLSGNAQINDVIPTAIAQLVKLTGLGLSDTSFHGTIPSEIGALIGLQMLFVSSTSLSGVVPSILCNFPLFLVYIGNSKFDCYAECLTTINGVQLDSGTVPACGT